MTAEVASYWLWGAWYLTWWIAAFWAARATVRPPRGGSNLDRALAGFGTMLLFVTPARAPGAFWPFARIWVEPPQLAWALIAIIVLAFAFCWWARAHLGRLWSGLVTLKAEHRVVDTGPYRLVRHPIYTGVMAAAAVEALLKATPAALLGAAMLIAGFWLTARKEEGFLSRQLGAEAYADYSRRTPMLVPFTRRWPKPLAT